MIENVAQVVLCTFGVLAAYTYLGYPALLLLGGARKRSPTPAERPAHLPSISIVIAAYNEEAQIEETIEGLLALRYPPHLRQILIVSDASTDRTDEIVRSFSDRGVELLRLPQRGGKTTAENAASPRLNGEIVVNTDASVRIRPDALEPMVAAFTDPAVGVVSGQDVSVSSVHHDANRGEGAYVSFEMWVRELETRVGGIVGASGSFFAIRSELQRIPAPPHLSRDFAAALVAEEHGLRAVSLPQAVCYVPRTDIRAEYRRKVRTFTRGMETLAYKKHLLIPGRHPAFAWKLISHKVLRWVMPWASLAAYLALGVLARAHALPRAAFALVTLVLVVGAIGWWRAVPGRSLPGWISLPAYALIGNVAVLHASLLALYGERAPTWEPTRREVVYGQTAASTRAPGAST